MPFTSSIYLLIQTLHLSPRYSLRKDSGPSQPLAQTPSQLSLKCVLSLHHGLSLVILLKPLNMFSKRGEWKGEW